MHDTLLSRWSVRLGALLLGSLLLLGAHVARADSLPAITAVTPGSGQPGTSVRFDGTNFVPGQTTANFGSTVAGVVPATCSSSILCFATAPALAGAVTVTLTTPAGTSNGLVFTFTGPVPGISAISPQFGPAGTQVTITGSNLIPGQTTAAFGTVPVAATCLSGMSCVAVAPAQAGGTSSVQLTVSTPNGTSNGVPYSYGVPAQITLSPTSGAAGTTVTFIGSGFTSGTATAIFGSATASATCTSATTCTAVAPQQPAGTTTVSVSLFINGVPSSPVQFTYTNSAPAIALSPTTGASGTTVTFTGAGFVVGTTVAVFGNVATIATCSSATSCTAVAPAQPAGTTAVQVYIVNNGAASGQAQFTYGTATAAPTITQIQPATAPAGSVVTITGAGFVTGSSGTSFNFGSTAASIVNCSSTTSCTVSVPTGSGTVSVTATVNGQASAPASFTYYNPVALTLNAIGTLQGSVGQPLSFSVTGPNLPPDTVFTWTFGDGASANGQSVTHAYAAPGVYPVTVTALSATAQQSASTTGQASVTAISGPSVTYQAGWNLVSGPSGTSFPQALGALYTFQAGDAAYESLPDTSGINGGRGYWAYFAAATTVPLSGSGPAVPYSLTVPASQYVLVGNPSTNRSVTIIGADIVYTWSPASNSYATLQGLVALAPGQGAWVYSAAGAVITLQ